VIQVIAVVNQKTELQFLFESFLYFKNEKLVDGKKRRCYLRQLETERQITALLPLNLYK
jgi:hypothetical protein